MPFPHPTPLLGQYFPILPHSIVLEVLSMLASKLGWLVMYLLKIVEGEIKIDQRFGVIKWAHRLFMIFYLSRAL
jgi:hypothetical protein